jgi:hypothetical protein
MSRARVFKACDLRVSEKLLSEWNSLKIREPIKIESENYMLLSFSNFKICCSLSSAGGGVTL